MNMRSEFDIDLIKSYDVNGPRYTSYPTANLFSEAFDPDIYAAALERLGETSVAPLSLYVHVPFCDTICFYCACNKIITNNRRHAVEYLQRLQREMALVSERLPDQHRVEQLHFGGGTPTYLTNDQFTALFGALRQNFRLADDADRDFSIEIDPRTVDPERVAFLTDLGINRMSLGIQDFDEEVQLAVNRLQSEEDTARIITTARDHGVRSVSVDLIYGLPQQNPQRFDRTLQRVIGLRPDRISLYSYAHLPQRFKTQRQIRDDQLPDAATKLTLLQMAVESFAAAGYQHIGMDHFALPSDELVQAQQNGSLHRNFQGYTTHGHCDLIGLGVSAISSVRGVYSQSAKTLSDYNEAVDAGRLPVERGLELTAEDHMIRDLIARLMCHFELDLDGFRQRWGVSLPVRFPLAWQRLQEMQADGLLELAERSLRVTRKGRFLIRNICMVFDAYLPAATTGFSRAI